MAKFRALRSDKQIVDLGELLRAGKLQLLHEHSPAGDIIFVLTPRGQTTAYIHPSQYEAVLKILDELGAGDGLFPGFSQTSAIGRPLANDK
jgi:hypothetical protein